MIREASLEELESFLLTLPHPKRGEAKTSSYSHLRDALSEWRLEKAWEHGFPPFVYEVNNQILGVIFYRWTSREPRHTTLRHILTVEESRGKKVAEHLINHMYKDSLDNKIYRVRFFINNSAIPFYKKLGFKSWGISKTGLPFVYCFIVRSDVRVSNQLVFTSDKFGEFLGEELNKQKSKLRESYNEWRELVNE